MARHSYSRSRALAAGLALCSIASVACSKSSMPTPAASPTPVPTGTIGPIASPPPCSNSLGIAYAPDNGVGTFRGIAAVHFEDALTSNLCVSGSVAATPLPITFGGASAGELVTSPDFSDAVVLLATTAGQYSYVQDIFGIANGSITPALMPYNLAAQPPPVAGTSPSPAPLIADAGAISILGSQTGAVAFTVGSGTQNIVELSSLTNAPPIYIGSSPYAGANYTLGTAPAYPRNLIRISIDTNGNATALVRGPQDLLAFGITAQGPSLYTVDLKSEDVTLGTNATLRGKGAMALSPTDSSRALVGGATATGKANVLTLVTGLPASIVHASQLTLPGNISSVSILPNGSIGVIGTDAGIVVVSGVNTGSLALVTPFTTPTSTTANVLPYRACTGAIVPLSNVASAALSYDNRYLVALGTTPGLACPSGSNGSIVAVPFNPTTGSSPSPAPTSTATGLPTAGPTTFVQNNVSVPPPGTDTLFVH